MHISKKKKNKKKKKEKGRRVWSSRPAWAT
jgi:hypothetical protein